MNTIPIEDKNRIGSEDGFSLVEVMIAMAIFLVGVLGVMGMQYYAIAGNAFSREIRQASLLNKDLMERSRVSAIAPGPFDPGAMDQAQSGGVTFTRRLWALNDCLALNIPNDNETCEDQLAVCTLNPDGGAEVQNVRAVRVRTCWTDRNGGIHSVSFDSVEAQ